MKIHSLLIFIAVSLVTNVVYVAAYRPVQDEADATRPDQTNSVAPKFNKQEQLQESDIEKGSKAPSEIEEGSKEEESEEGSKDEEIDAPSAIQEGTKAPLAIQEGTEESSAIQEGTEAPLAIQEGTEEEEIEEDIDATYLNPPQEGREGPSEIHPPQEGTEAPSAIHPPQEGTEAPSALHPSQEGTEGPSEIHPPQEGREGPSAIHPPQEGTEASSAIQEGTPTTKAPSAIQEGTKAPSTNQEGTEEEEFDKLDGTVTCPGMGPDEYCDCTGDCTEMPEYCVCEEAQNCCIEELESEIDVLSGKVQSLVGNSFSQDETEEDLEGNLRGRKLD